MKGSAKEVVAILEVEDLNSLRGLQTVWQVLDQAMTDWMKLTLLGIWRGADMGGLCTPG